jgi:prepilin peptidase CpaA
VRHAPPALLVALAVLAAALAASVVTDLRSRLILNRVTLPSLLLVVLCHLVAAAPADWPAGLRSSLLGLAVCGGPLFFASLAGFVGMGDAKLMAVVGAALGFPWALAALFWVAVAGGAQALLLVVVARLRGAERPRHVPYACAIAAGTVAAVFF